MLPYADVHSLAVRSSVQLLLQGRVRDSDADLHSLAVGSSLFLQGRVRARAPSFRSISSLQMQMHVRPEAGSVRGLICGLKLLVHWAALHEALSLQVYGALR
jgi:hypothetical protein